MTAIIEYIDDGAIQASPYRDQIMDVMEELMHFTHINRDQSEFLVDRYSERKAAGYYENITEENLV